MRIETFFDHGGNSLQIISVRQHLEASLGVPISLVNLFRYPTVSALAPALSSSEPSPSPRLAKPDAVASDRGWRR